MGKYGPFFWVLMLVENAQVKLKKKQLMRSFKVELQ